MKNEIKKAADILIKSKYAVAFTGAGISVESGIAPFRGENGIWNKYEEKLFEINYFTNHTKEAWEMLCDGFYKGTLDAKPNAAHFALARLEEKGIIKSVITQNIDNLHTKAGSKTVYELHGNAGRLHCIRDNTKYSINEFDLKTAPKCRKCNALLKPDFVFFGEMLPEYDINMSQKDSLECDVMLIIGSTGVVYPAAMLPANASQNGAIIIEINPSPSAFTGQITNIFIPMKAGEAMPEIEKLLTYNK
jgi:NAD-dependent deacetylase